MLNKLMIREDSPPVILLVGAFSDSTSVNKEDGLARMFGAGQPSFLRFSKSDHGHECVVLFESA
jgi:hypothetical protein